MKKPLSLISTTFAALAVAAPLCAQTNENWTEVNLAVVDKQVTPRYADLNVASAHLADLAGSFCSDLNETSLSNIQQAYHGAMDAWQAIEHIQFGPVTYFNWNFRLEYWPDEKGTGGRQLNAFIKGQDQAALVSANFARQSVSIQGFPALERLLFAEDSLEDLSADSYRCQVSQTIASNIAEISSGVYQRWVDEFRAVVANADDSDQFESAEDATIDLLKALVESIPRIYDQKLLAVLGDTFTDSRGRRAESWRSERSLRNIKINFTSLAQFFGSSEPDSVVLASVLMPDDVLAINKVFSAINITLNPLPDSMQQVLQSEELYESLELLLLQLEDLDDLLEEALKNTDLYLGFNSLDGD